MIGHWVEVCRHGVIKAQCRCPGEKTVQVVPCRVLTEPAWLGCEPLDMSLPERATILMDTGVYEETRR